MQMEFYLSFASILENEYYWWYEYISLKKEYTSILEKFHKNLLCSKQDQFPRNKCEFHKIQILIQHEWNIRIESEVYNNEIKGKIEL